MFSRPWFKTSARVFVLGALACAVVLTAAFALGDERIGWIELLRYVPYLAWLVPAGAALGLSLFLGNVWRLAGLATVLLVAVPVMGLSAGLDRVAHAERPELRRVRVMTYNIKAYEAEWRGYEAIAAEIAGHAPDVLVLQDADRLNEREGLPPVMQAVLKDYRLQGFGQYVVASRLPLRGCQVQRVALTEGRDLTYVQCVVQVDRTALTLVTTHLLTPRRGLNAARAERLAGLDDWQRNVAMRMAQARHLSDVVARLPRPLVLAGDLNAPEHSPVVQVLLDAGLRDAYGAAGRGWGYTLGHALKPYVSFLRIDHVLVSPDILVGHAEVGGRQGSEHRPVVADLLVAH